MDGAEYLSADNRTLDSSARKASMNKTAWALTLLALGAGYACKSEEPQDPTYAISDTESAEFVTLTVSGMR